MKHFTDINDRPFKAIKAGTKKVEGRTITTWETLPLDELKKDEIISFTNNITNEKLVVKITFVHHYKSVSEMLKKEGVKNVLSSFPKTIEHGIESYHSILEYKNSIQKHGIWAIGLKVV